jgi:branched-chain amino acid transport system ATP-binding protein
LYASSSSEAVMPQGTLSVSGLSVGYESIRFSVESKGIRGVFGVGRRVYPVLSSLSFRIAFDTPLVGIVGANGAGKTTLLRAIAGIVPSQGAVTWNDQQLNGLSQHQRHRLGLIFIPHENGIFPSLTVQEHLQLMGFVENSRRSTLEELLDRASSHGPELATSLDFLRRDERAGNLSGGERKLLGLVRLLARPWSLALIDEPTAGLSPRSVATFAVLLSMVYPACVVATEQYSRAGLVRSMGAKLYELKEGSLEIWKEARQ